MLLLFLPSLLYKYILPGAEAPQAPIMVSFVLAVQLTPAWGIFSLPAASADNVLARNMGLL